MTEAAEQAPVNYVQAIRQVESRFIKIAPPAMKFEAEVGFAMAILRNNDYMMNAATQCPQSLQQAMAAIASTGLSLNPVKKEAYLITRNMKVKGEGGREFWQTRIFLEPSYMGMVNLATNTGSIEWVQARCVYSADEFTDHGPGIRPTHNYNAFAKKEARGEFVGVYCVAKAGPDYLTAIMTADEVLSIRNRSESWKNKLKKAAEGKTITGGPWETDFEEMAKKSVIRNGYKTWPKTDKLSRLEEAVHISNENEGFEPMLSAPPLATFNAEQKAYFDGLITNSDALGMFVLQCTMDESMFTNLYNSFEKGSVTKYKRIVGDLLSKGASIVEDCATAIREGIEQGDDSAIAEIVDGMSSDAIGILRDRLPQNMKSAFDAAVKAA